VLLSPLSVDTEPRPGPVLPLSSSSGGAAGFAEQFQSLNAAPRAAQLPLQTIGASNNLSDSGSQHGVASLVAALMSARGSSNQSALQPSGRAIPTPVASESDTSKGAAPAPDRESVPTPTVTGGASIQALDTGQDNSPCHSANGSDTHPTDERASQKKQRLSSLTPVLSIMVRPQTSLSTAAATKGYDQTPPQAVIPSPANAADAQTAPAPLTLSTAWANQYPNSGDPVSGPGAPLLRELTARIGDPKHLVSPVHEYARDRTPAASANESVAETGLPSSPMQNISTGLPPDVVTSQLAFAVKVQQRISAGNTRNAPDAAAPAGDSTVANGGGNPEARAAQHDGGSDTGQPPENPNVAATKTAGKRAAADADPRHYSATGEGSSVHVDSASGEGHWSAGGTIGKSGPSVQNRPAIDEAVLSDKPASPTAPMKDISVRVESAKGENVDIRIVQRAGDLQIAVKSADGDITQGLRHGLSDLSNRLNTSGYDAETWQPGQHTTTAETAAKAGDSPHHPPSGDSQSHSGWSQQHRGQRDNNPSNRPRWIQELESKASGTAESTGEFHGLIR
jgi:hypothetical protein